MYIYHARSSRKFFCHPVMNPEIIHFHVIFNIPGAVRCQLFESSFKQESLIKEAAKVYWQKLRVSEGDFGKAWSAWIVATIHTCGNVLNYNPQVHLIGIRELVNTETGEMNTAAFVQFNRMRFAWMDAA